MRAFPGRLRDESRLFVADWRAKRHRAASGDEAAAEAALRRRTPRGVPRFPGAATIVAGREDDANAIIGRIEIASEVEVLLVVPRRARRLRDAMAWPRIAAYSRQRGLSIRVIASRREVREHALNSGLSTARTPRGLRPAPTLRLPLGPRVLTLRLPPLTPLLRFAAVAAVPILLVGAAVYYVPSADVFIAPPGEPLTRSVRVQLNPVEETDIAARVVAATSITETIVTVVSTVSTGTATVGEVPATVDVEFTNTGPADTRLPVGTAVDDEGGFTFTTDEAVTVPADGTAVVGATAIRPGTAGNLEAGSLRLLIGFPETLTVTNPVAARGGEDIEVLAASAEDAVRVGEIAESVLRRAGARALLRLVEDGTVFPETVSVAILSQEALVQPGEPAEAFLMEYTAIVSALVLNDEAARHAGEQILVGALPEGSALLPGTAEVTAEDPSYDGSRLVVTLYAVGLSAPLFDPASLSGTLTGVAPAEAALRLRERLSLDTDPLIRVHPGWLPAWWMPRRQDRISVVFVSQEELAAQIAGVALDDAEGDAAGEDDTTGEDDEGADGE